MQGWFDIWKVGNTIHHTNRLISHGYFNWHKKTDKLQHPLMIKPLSNLGIEGNYLNSIKNIYKPPYSYIILNGDKWMLSPSDQEQGEEVYSCNLFNIVVEVSASAIRQGNETQRWRLEGKKLYCSIYRWHDGLSTYQKESTKKLPRLSEGIQQECKINTQKWSTFL